MEALRNDMQQQPKVRVAEVVDLVTGDHSFRKNVPSVERRLELFAAPAAGIVTKTLRQAIEPKLQPADVIGPRTALGIMRDLLLVTEIRTKEGELLGFMGFEGELGFLLIERAFGAPTTDTLAEGGYVAPNRSKLTDVERHTLIPILKEMGKDLRQRMFEDGPALKVDQVPGGLPPEIPSRVETTLVWRLLFDMGAERHSALVLVLLPDFMDLVVRRSTEVEDPKPDWLPRHLSAMPVELSCTLGGAALSVRELLSLKEGDILRLDRGRDEAIPIHIEGQKKFLGMPVQKNGAYGIEVVTDLGDIKEVQEEEVNE